MYNVWLLLFNIDIPNSFSELIWHFLTSFAPMTDNAD